MKFVYNEDVGTDFNYAIFNDVKSLKYFLKDDTKTFLETNINVDTSAVP